MNESKWRKFILNEAVDVKVKDLTFDKVKEVFKDKYQEVHTMRKQPNGKDGPTYKDAVAFRASRDMLSIIDSKALEQWKKDILSIDGIDPNVEVTLDPDASMWFDKTKIDDPTYIEYQNRRNKGIEAFYDRAKIDRKTGGRYTGD